MNGFGRQGANVNDVSETTETTPGDAADHIGGYLRTREIISTHAERSKLPEGHTDEPDSNVDEHEMNGFVREGVNSNDVSGQTEITKVAAKRIGRYVRTDEPDINVDEYAAKISDILDKMKMWGLDKPNLLISVTGEAKNFQMNKRLRDTFRRGLRKIVLTTGAWIITGGTNSGVSKLVGEAVKECRIVSKKPVIAIGIAPSSKESCLDRNHLHCILMDYDTQHKLVPFRAKLERAITKFGTDTNSVVNAVPVSIVLLVLNGGPETFETVYQAIDNNTTTVVVKGSGRAADILACAYQNATVEENQTRYNDGTVQKKIVRRMDESLTTKVNEMVKKEFGPREYGVHVNRSRPVSASATYCRYLRWTVNAV